MLNQNKKKKKKERGGEEEEEGHRSISRERKNLGEKYWIYFFFEAVRFNHGKLLIQMESRFVHWMQMIET